MARVKGGQRLMQMNRRRRSVPSEQAQPSRTMVPGGMADRLRQGRGPVGGIPPAGLGGGGAAQTKRPQSGLIKNFGKSLQGLFNRGVQKAGGVLAAGAQLGRQANEMQRIQGEVQGIAGQLDTMTKAKEQFDSHADELSNAIIQNHVESVGLGAMMKEMREQQEAQAAMRLMHRESRQVDPAPADFRFLNESAAGPVPNYPRFEWGEDALAEFDRLIADGKALPKFIQLDDGAGGWQTIDVARDIPEFAPLVEGSRAEILRREIREGIEKLQQ